MYVWLLWYKPYKTKKYPSSTKLFQIVNFFRNWMDIPPLEIFTVRKLILRGRFNCLKKNSSELWVGSFSFWVLLLNLQNLWIPVNVSRFSLSNGCGSKVYVRLHQQRTRKRSRLEVFYTYPHHTKKRNKNRFFCDALKLFQNHKFKPLEVC